MKQSRNRLVTGCGFARFRRYADVSAEWRVDRWRREDVSRQSALLLWKQRRWGVLRCSDAMSADEGKDSFRRLFQQNAPRLATQTDASTATFVRKRRGRQMRTRLSRVVETCKWPLSVSSCPSSPVCSTSQAKTENGTVEITPNDVACDNNTGNWKDGNTNAGDKIYVTCVKREQ